MYINDKFGGNYTVPGDPGGGPQRIHMMLPELPQGLHTVAVRLVLKDATLFPDLTFEDSVDFIYDNTGLGGYCMVIVMCNFCFSVSGGRSAQTRRFRWYKLPTV